MKNKTLIAYKEIDLESIFNSAKNKQAEADTKKESEYQKNIKELLPFVLELANGVAKMHNMGCKKASYSVTGRDGYLGGSKIDVQEKLDYILKSAETNNDSVFKVNGTIAELFYGKYKIWLNNSKTGNFNAGLHPTYSMATVANKGQGKDYTTIEQELRDIAEKMAKYRMTENWD